MKILLVQTGFIGDVVLSTPVISALRAIYPTAKITVMTQPVAEQLVAFHPAGVKTIPFDKRRSDSGISGLFSFAQRLRDEEFDAVFSLHKSWRTALLLRLAKIPERFAFAEASGRFLYTKTSPRSDLAHDVERNLAILRNIEKEPSDFSGPMVVGISEQAEREAERLLDETDGAKLIGIAPGSVWATKRWTAEGFAAVADHFALQGYRPVLIGGIADQESGREVEALMKAKPVNLLGRSSLLVSAAVIGQLQLLVSNDSAPLHLASAMHTPVVATFCATVPEFGFGPWQVPSRVVGVDGLSCRPCGRHGGNNCPTGTHACQRDLTSQQVIKACSELLAEVYGTL